MLRIFLSSSSLSPKLKRSQQEKPAIEWTDMAIWKKEKETKLIKIYTRRTWSET